MEDKNAQQIMRSCDRAAHPQNPNCSSGRDFEVGNIAERTQSFRVSNAVPLRLKACVSKHLTRCGKELVPTSGGNLYKCQLFPSANDMRLQATAQR